MTLFLTLFVAGLLTILLPCILPLIPIVLGVSIADKNPWRPLATILGMLVSFVGFTFLLFVVLSQFVTLADYIRVTTYYILFLFGLGFVTQNRYAQLIGAILGAVFFYDGWIAILIAQTFGAIAMELGGKIATKIQQFGTNVQQKAVGEFGSDTPVTAFIIGLTLGLVWVPCAGPALGFAFTLVREEPGLRAAAALASYGLGTALPLLLVGYGGQAAVHSVRALAKYTGLVKQIAGGLLILTSLGLQSRFFEQAQIWLLENTNFGDLGTRIEERLFERDMYDAIEEEMGDNADTMKLPKLTRAPEFAGLGPWHNADPFTLASLKGKVVLVDFWTYSCINCIRTLPYIQGYWDKFKDTDKFVLIGVHAPEFVFEKSEKNVADAIERHKLTYPVAQDNDFKTWRAFANRYWPAKYLIDAEGYIRYTHFGEGDYEETDAAIAILLEEIGVTVKETDETKETKDAEVKGRKEVTPETYLGSRSWPALGNAVGNPTDESVTYTAPDSLALHKYYLEGVWNLVDEERQVLESDTGAIRMKFKAGEINLVLGMDNPAVTPRVAITVDGKKTKEFDVDHHDLYQLFKGEYGEHEITIAIQGKGLAGYAFTFGG
ncbi:hypothetical protein A2706_04210 [Candidatus Peribacteria bacterium RIFCSPHIGHO2_01_FULL_51_35]|nr:MAG: hypothetical protein A2706_04210 [Candidatus Peribacteria bacterium RIFCSPHIGHO2_01_FULL_51_35]